MAHCAGCGGHYSGKPCLGCGHEAEIAALTAELESCRQVVSKTADAWQIANNDRKILRIEQYALQEDLKALAMELKQIQRESPTWTAYYARCRNALARPGVQKILEVA